MGRGRADLLCSSPGGVSPLQALSMQPHTLVSKSAQGLSHPPPSVVRNKAGVDEI
jgi:hypothetical protein